MAEGKAKSISKDKRKGKVHFIKTGRGLFPFAVLAKAEIKHGESQQIKQEREWLSEKGLIPLPFNVAGLLTLQENCTYFDACARQIAQDVVGQGWKIVSAKPEEDVDKSEKEEAERFLGDPNSDDETIEEIIKRCVLDWGTVGWWGIEVSRGPDRKVDGLWHMPGHTIRVHKDEVKYCQVRGSKKRWFKKFGYEKDVNKETGQELKGRSKNPAKELIFGRRYTSGNDYYGQPPILPAVGAVRGLIGVRDYNLSFFENYGIPAALVTLEGEWEENSAKEINDFLDVEIKGSENAHKTLVLELPEGGTCTWKPLSVETKEGSFNLYYKDMRNECLSAYKMPPYRIGIAETGSLGGSTAKEATHIYIDSVINPLKKAFAQVVTSKILAKGMSLEKVAFEFEKLDIRNLLDEIKIWEFLFGTGSININWLREQMGLRPVDHGDGYFILGKYLPFEMAGAATPQQMSQNDIDEAFKDIREKLKKEAQND